MAGIGFELKKVFSKRTITSTLKGSSYAIFVTSGPMIINLIMIVLLVQILKISGAPTEAHDLFESAIMYAYIFSLITVSGLTMLVSRYAADKLYIRDTTDLLASMLGVIAIGCAMGSLIGGVFYAFSPLPLIFRLLSYLVFIELCVINLLMVYVSAVKDYQKVAVSFFIGLTSAFLFSFFFISLNVETLTAVLLGVVIGFLMNILFLISVLKRFFQIVSARPFAFLSYLKWMPLLFFTNLLYTLGLFGHNILFWLFSDLSVSAMSTFRYAPAYDNATFYAIFTIIPSVVIFVVKVETSFYEQFRAFGQSISHGGTLRDIRNAQKKMVEILKNELSSIFELQLIITTVSIIAGVNLILPLFERNPQTLRLFVLLAIGYFLAYMMFILITLLLYFDNQEAAFRVALLFVTLNIALTMISLRLGPAFYGLGICVSSLISMLAGMHLLNSTLSDAVYQMFSGHGYST